MTDRGTVISRFRSPAWITTRAVMTFTMLPIGRSVFRARLHKTLPVAALAKAAPDTWEGPPTTASAACSAETACLAEVVWVPAAACVREAVCVSEAPRVTELAWLGEWAWTATRGCVPLVRARKTAAPDTSRAVMTARTTRTGRPGENMRTFTNLNRNRQRVVGSRDHRPIGVLRGFLGWCRSVRPRAGVRGRGHARMVRAATAFWSSSGPASARNAFISSSCVAAAPSTRPKCGSWWSRAQSWEGCVVSPDCHTANRLLRPR